MKLWSRLQRQLCAFDQSPALTRPDGSVSTYHELLARVEQLARVIRQSTPEDGAVAILGSQPYYDGIGVLATLAAGRVVVPLTAHYGEEHACKIIETIRPCALLTGPEEAPALILAAARRCGIPIIVGSTPVAPLQDGFTRFPAEVAMVMFTSGTTGRPRGVMLTDDGIWANLSDIAQYFPLGPSDHVLVLRPLAHASAMTGEFLYGLCTGAQITLYPEAFSPRRVLRYIERHQITALCATPTLFYHLALDPTAPAITTLKQAAVSGEPLQSQVAKRIRASFPQIEFFNVYGLTEASPRVTYLAPAHFDTKPGSIGVPLASVKVRIVGTDGGDSSPGEIGELAVRGPNVMLGYWNDGIATSARMKDGWLYTGDLAYSGPDGFLYLVGRSDDMIIRAGVNIFPSQIEEPMLQNPAIREVVAWGEPDLRYGQRICVAVVPTVMGALTEQDVMTMCRQEFATHLWPDAVRIVAELPRGASGKILRRAYGDKHEDRPVHGSGADDRI